MASIAEQLILPDENGIKQGTDAKNKIIDADIKQCQAILIKDFNIVVNKHIEHIRDFFIEFDASNCVEQLTRRRHVPLNQIVTP